MIKYYIGILPITREIRDSHPHDNDTGAGGTLSTLWDHIGDLMVCAPPQGYLPDPNNRILVVSEKNFPQTEAYFQGMGLKVVTRRRYLGGLIGDQAVETAFIAEKVRSWTKSVEIISGVARRNLHTAYDGLKKSHKQECDFVRHFNQ